MKSTEGEAPVVTVRRAAMNLLARREQSFHELLNKLTEKYPDFSPDEVIRPALERLRDQDLQSDSRFVDAYVRYRSTRGVGPLKIAAELYPRKVDEQLQQQALYDSGIDWQDLCEASMRKKYRDTPCQDMNEKQRRVRFLQQRGFDSAQIRKALRS